MRFSCSSSAAANVRISRNPSESPANALVDDSTLSGRHANEKRGQRSKASTLRLARSGRFPDAPRSTTRPSRWNVSEHRRIEALRRATYQLPL
jgi:hypothetical protein